MGFKPYPLGFDEGCCQYIKPCIKLTLTQFELVIVNHKRSCQHFWGLGDRNHGRFKGPSVDVTFLAGGATLEVLFNVLFHVGPPEVSLVRV